MKSDNAATPKSKKKNSGSESNAAGNTTKKNKVSFNDASLNAVEKTKPRSGRGLANEGTIVSYDEER